MNNAPFQLKEKNLGMLDRSKPASTCYQYMIKENGDFEIRVALSVTNTSNLKVELRDSRTILVTEDEKCLFLSRNAQVMNDFRLNPKTAIFENGFLTLQFEKIVEEQLLDVALEIR